MKSRRAPLYPSNYQDHRVGVNFEVRAKVRVGVDNHQIMAKLTLNINLNRMALIILINKKICDNDYSILITMWVLIV